MYSIHDYNTFVFKAPWFLKNQNSMILLNQIGYGDCPNFAF